MLIGKWCVWYAVHMTHNKCILFAHFPRSALRRVHPSTSRYGKLRTGMECITWCVVHAATFFTHKLALKIPFPPLEGISMFFSRTTAICAKIAMRGVPSRAHKKHQSSRIWCKPPWKMFVCTCALNDAGAYFCAYLFVGDQTCVLLRKTLGWVLIYIWHVYMGVLDMVRVFVFINKY